MEAFEAQVELAEELKKPLILHVVHAADTILGLHKVLGPRQPWIIHGFRGKPALAEQYLSQGLRLSFGEHFSPDALRICPQGTFFAETDESTLPIDTIWARLLAEHPDAEPLLTLDGCGE
jgi:TatD DNase family protein